MNSPYTYLAGPLLFSLASATPFDRSSAVMDDCTLDWGTGEAFEHRRKQTIWCWAEGRARYDKDWQCYDLNSQGPCEEGSRIVYMEGTVCPVTTCRRYTDLSGDLCTNGTISYQGKCANPKDPAACGLILGRRLEADPWGNYSCQCSSTHGFVELEGKCWPRYLQGPCKMGEQVAKNSEGEVVCREDTCTPPSGALLITDFYLGPGNVCFDLATIFSKLASANLAFTREEADLVEKDSKIVNSPHHGEIVDIRKTCAATHCTCKRLFEETGECEEPVTINIERFEEAFNILELVGLNFNSTVVEESIIEISESIIDDEL